MTKKEEAKRIHDNLTGSIPYHVDRVLHAIIDALPEEAQCPGWVTPNKDGSYTITPATSPLWEGEAWVSPCGKFFMREKPNYNGWRCIKVREVR